MEITTLRQFCEVLIETGEIDPSYIMLHRLRSTKGDEWVKRFCVAYLLFYHTGTAANAAQYEGVDFWSYLNGAFNEPNTRGTERRHFRGDNGRKALHELWARYMHPESWFDLPRYHSPNYGIFYDLIKHHKIPQFGDYFIWKWNDFSMCVFDDDRDMRKITRYLPQPPRKALTSIWKDEHYSLGLARLTQMISDIPEPFAGTPRRMCGPSEAETIACSIKGYIMVHPPTPVGYDIEEKKQQLRFVKDEDLARMMESYLPASIAKNTYRVDKHAILGSARVSA
jgi:hypothetical protein